MLGRLPVRPVLLLLLSVCLFAPGLAADTILVAPFENVNRAAELDWVSESFAEGLTARLLGHDHGLVTRDERLAALERLGLPGTAPLSRASLLRLGEEVGADWVVLGRFAVNDKSLQVGLQLLDLRRPRLGRWVEHRGLFAGLLEAQGWLAWEVLKRIDPALSLSREEFQRRHPELRVSAFESYVRGLLAMSQEQQRRYFLQASRLQPDYSPAVFRLAMLDFEQLDYGAAASWLARIPPDDPLSSEAGFYLALCYYFQGSPSRAAETLTPVARRFPVSSVWNNLGVFTSRQGQADSAVDYFSRALADGPGNPDACFNLGLHYLRAGDWPSSAGTLRRCTDLNPGDAGALLLYAQALERLGRPEEARAARQQAGGNDSPKSLDIASTDLDRLHQRLLGPQAGAGAERPGGPGRVPASAAVAAARGGVAVDRRADRRVHPERGGRAGSGGRSGALRRVSDPGAGLLGGAGGSVRREPGPVPQPDRRGAPGQGAVHLEVVRHRSELDSGRGV